MEIFTQTKGPTNCAAATETRIGGADIEIPTRQQSFTIVGVCLRAANVAEDLAAAGILELKINTTNGPFKFVVCNGIGGATGNAMGLPENIPMNIPINGGAKVGIYCTFPNATVDVVAELQYVNGRQGKITYSDAPALTASIAADTRGSIGSITLLPGQWTLTKFRWVGGNVVDAKSRAGVLELTGGSIIAAEHILGVGMGAGASAQGNSQPAEVKELGIPHSGAVTLTVYATMAEAYLHLGYSIQYE